MPQIDKHEPGMFSWADLATTDVDAAKTFYTGLFGWKYRDDPMGPDAYYSSALLADDRDACAMFKQGPEQAGIPPHWNAYIAVDSADATAAAAKQHGGKVIVEPLDVFDFGRMSVVADPTGAAIAVWQAKTHPGSRIFAEHGALCWTELMTGDIGAAGAFYARTFRWVPEAMPMPGFTYTVFKVGDKPAAGMMPTPPEMKDMPPFWMVYFSVNSCDETAAKAESLGGKIMNPPADIPNVGRFAILADPQGVGFAILQAAM